METNTHTHTHSHTNALGFICLAVICILRDTHEGSEVHRFNILTGTHTHHLGVYVLYVFQYVAVIITFKLFRTSITLREEPNVPEILKVQMIDLSTSISQRPGAQAIK